MSAAPIGILCMAYGTASGPDDVERYYTDIRGGRPPAPEHLAELKARYEAIGNRFPLLEITEQQAAALERTLNDGKDGRAFRTFLGMKHSPPFIAQGVQEMRDAGIEQGDGDAAPGKLLVSVHAHRVSEYRPWRGTVRCDSCCPLPAS